MKQIKRSAIFLSLIDFMRFGIFSILLLPLLSKYFTITENFLSNYRLLLWTISPQLLLPLYTVAVAFSVISDRHLKQIGFISKGLSIFPGTLTLITMFIQANGKDSEPFSNIEELHIYIRFTLILFLDILFTTVLLMYKRRDEKQEHR